MALPTPTRERHRQDKWKNRPEKYAARTRARQQRRAEKLEAALKDAERLLEEGFDTQTWVRSHRSQHPEVSMETAIERAHLRFSYTYQGCSPRWDREELNPRDPWPTTIVPRVPQSTATGPYLNRGEY